MQYLGDFAEDATVYIPFNTFTSDDPQASVTIGALADTDIYVHKDGSIVDIVTDGATVVIDFDGITGNHLLTIDTAADAAYSTGSDYMVRIEGTTVDGGTINAIIGSFSIENRFREVTVTSMATDVLTAASLNTDAVTEIQNGLATPTNITAGTIATVTNLTNAPTNGDLTSTMKASVNTEVDSAIVTYGLDHLVAASVTGTDITDNSIIAMLVDDAVTADWDNYDNTTASLEALNVDTDTIITDTVDIQSRIPAALSSGNMKSDMLAISTSTASADNLEASAGTIVIGTATGVPTSTTMAATGLSESTDDHYNGRIIIWTSGVLSGQATAITDYTGSTNLFTFTGVTDSGPSAGDTFVIV